MECRFGTGLIQGTGSDSTLTFQQDTDSPVESTMPMGMIVNLTFFDTSYTLM